MTHRPHGAAGRIHVHERGREGHELDRRIKHVVPALPEAQVLHVHLHKELQGVDVEGLQEHAEHDHTLEPSGPGDAGDVASILVQSEK